MIRYRIRYTHPRSGHPPLSWVTRAETADEAMAAWREMVDEEHGPRAACSIIECSRTGARPRGARLARMTVPPGTHVDIRGPARSAKDRAWRAKKGTG